MEDKEIDATIERAKEINQDMLREQEIREKNDGFLQKEAFCMMTYHCNTCHRSERIWNSRDGVTPFCCHCLCGGEMRHINWSGDRRDVNHLPKRGDRIFIDLPKAVHAIYMKIRVDKFWLDPNIPKFKETKEEVVEELLKTWKEGEPFLLTWE